MQHDPGGRVKIRVPDHVISKVLFSKDKKHRYYLERRWGKAKNNSRCVVFLLMNPSTADAKHNDPTIAKCIRFAIKWGYERVIILNSISYRLTKSTALKNIVYKNKRNRQVIRRVLRKERRRTNVIAFGKPPKNMIKYTEQIKRLLANDDRAWFCFKQNKDGSPGHPLYISEKTQLQPYWTNYETANNR